MAYEIGLHEKCLQLICHRKKTSESLFFFFLKHWSTRCPWRGSWGPQRLHQVIWKNRETKFRCDIVFKMFGGTVEIFPKKKKERKKKEHAWLCWFKYFSIQWICEGTWLYKGPAHLLLLVTCYCLPIHTHHSKLGDNSPHCSECDAVGLCQHAPLIQMNSCCNCWSSDIKQLAQGPHRSDG